MNQIPATELRMHLVRRLETERERWQLGTGPIQVEPILNWGGFVKSSFRVTGAARTVHLKLATADDQAELRRWMGVHELLTAEYRAPQILGWIDLPHADCGGPVFQHIEGHAWDPCKRPALIGEIISLLDRMHRDQSLALRLGDSCRTYHDCWEMRYREQFEQDLKIVRAHRPPFVTETSLAWMEAESQKVLAIGREHPALDGQAGAPCHWDLWTDNILVGDNGAWWVLDWDGLAIGDEAQDLATAVWPHVFERKRDWRELFRSERDPKFAARMDLHLRAIMLDWTVDVLADWVDCEQSPWREQVRARNQQVHLRHIDWYRQRWG
ncbi:MAG: phosphotransferase [Gemmatimonadaceae bacterium]|nr:phosphotransferase [Gemmatimonadaceae bacterium]